MDLNSLSLDRWEIYRIGNEPKELIHTSPEDPAWTAVQRRCQSSVAASPASRPVLHPLREFNSNTC